MWAVYLTSVGQKASEEFSKNIGIIAAVFLFALWIYHHPENRNVMVLNHQLKGEMKGFS